MKRMLIHVLIAMLVCSSLSMFGCNEKKPSSDHSEPADTTGVTNDRTTVDTSETTDDPSETTPPSTDTDINVTVVELRGGRNEIQLEVIKTNKSRGFKIAEPQTPDLSSSLPTTTRHFIGWFLDKNCTAPWTPDTVFTCDTTIYGLVLQASTNLFEYTIQGGKAIVRRFTPTNNIVIPSTIESCPIELSSNFTVMLSNVKVDYLAICDNDPTVVFEFLKRLNHLYVNHLFIPATTTAENTAAILDQLSIWRLQFINVSAENPHLSSYNGILYNKDQTDILHVPDAIYGTVALSPTLTAIEQKDFKHLSPDPDFGYITELIIPSSVVSIDPSAFQEFHSSIKIIFEDPTGWVSETGTPIPAQTLSNSKTVLAYLKKLDGVMTRQSN